VFLVVVFPDAPVTKGIEENWCCSRQDYWLAGAWIIWLSVADYLPSAGRCFT
jgi:hypothetical protein